MSKQLTLFDEPGFCREHKNDLFVPSWRDASVKRCWICDGVEHVVTLRKVLNKPKYGCGMWGELNRWLDGLPDDTYQDDGGVGAMQAANE